MTDRSKLLTQKERGERADRILRDPLVVEAFDALRGELVRQWEDGDGPELREEAHRMLCATKLFRGEFERVLRTGQAAGMELSRQTEETELT